MLGGNDGFGAGQQGEARKIEAAPFPASLLSQHHLEVRLFFFVTAALSLFNFVS